MLWAACSVCFFGFFWAGEITVPTKHGFNPRSHLTWSDVSVDNIREPACIKFHLRISKCNQLGRDVDVFIGRVNDPICPVVACSSYIALRGPRPGPFFQFEDGSPLTKACFVQLVKEVVSEMGLDAELSWIQIAVVLVIVCCLSSLSHPHTPPHSTLIPYCVPPDDGLGWYI